MKESKIPSGTSWKRVLKEIYRFAPHQYGESSHMSISDDNHDLAKKLRITGYELMLSLSFLTDQQLVKRNIQPSTKSTPYSATFVITKKGFEVCLKLIEHQDWSSIQIGIFVLTTIIVLTGMGELLNQFEVINKTVLAIGYLGFYIILVIVGLIIIYDINK